MLAEYRTFATLIERHGTPRVLIANRPETHYWNKSRTRAPAARKPQVMHCRGAIGPEPFLLIRRYIEVDERDLDRARPALIALGVVEIVHNGERRTARGKRIPVVRVAVLEDVTPLSAPDFERALREQRVLAVYGERSMGDMYVSFAVATLDSRCEGAPIRFVFDPPCRLADLAFPSADGSWNSPYSVFDDFRTRFTRSLQGSRD